MRFDDVINYSFKNIGFKGLRSWLTIIGIVIGIAAVVGLMTYSESLNASITAQLAEFGSEIITITLGAPTRATTGFAPAPAALSYLGLSAETTAELFSDEDVESISDLPNIIAVSPSSSKRLNITYDIESASVNVYFINPSDYEIVNNIEVIEGSFIDDGDSGVVLGYSVANDFFSEIINPGDSILINDVDYFVSGVLERGGFGSNDNNIIMDLSEAFNLIDDFESGYEMLKVRVVSVESVEPTALLIEEALRVSRDVSEGDEDFQVFTATNLMNTVSEILSMLTFFIVGIAAISLLVGAISIANTMYTSVFERTREIGIMKAIGADDNEVMWLFLTEAAIISLIGGIGGMILGLLGAQALISIGASMVGPSGMAGPGGGQGLSTLSLVIRPELIALSILFSLVIGVVSGYLPARKAAKLNPIEAIWYE